MEALKRFIEKLSASGETVWPPIVLESDGFTTRDRLVHWSEINRISAFKRDLITIDDIWFQLDTTGGRVMVCEEQPGFKEWQAALAKEFDRGGDHEITHHGAAARARPDGGGRHGGAGMPEARPEVKLGVLAAARACVRGAKRGS